MPRRRNVTRRQPRRSNAVSAAAAAAIVGAAGPPSLVMGPRCGDVLRFQVSSTISTPIDITWGCLRNLYFQTITSSTASSMLLALRLSKVELWAPPITGATTGLGFASSIAVRFREGEGMIGQDKVVSDVSTTTQGAHIKAKFSKATTDTGKWHMANGIGSADVAFTVLNAPSGAIIDIHMSWQGWATGSAVFPLTCGALNVGRIYRNVLDNTDASGAIGGGVFLPIGFSGASGIAFG